jgi:hypothetical protein
VGRLELAPAVLARAWHEGRTRAAWSSHRRYSRGRGTRGERGPPGARTGGTRAGAARGEGRLGRGTMGVTQRRYAGAMRGGRRRGLRGGRRRRTAARDDEGRTRDPGAGRGLPNARRGEERGEGRGEPNTSWNPNAMWNWKLWIGRVTFFCLLEYMYIDTNYNKQRCRILSSRMYRN